RCYSPRGARCRPVHDRKRIWDFPPRSHGCYRSGWSACGATSRSRKPAWISVLLGVALGRGGASPGWVSFRHAPVRCESHFCAILADLRAEPVVTMIDGRSLNLTPLNVSLIYIGG